MGAGLESDLQIELFIWFFSVRLLNAKSDGGMWKSSQKKKKRKAFLFGVLITDKGKKRHDRSCRCFVSGTE